MAELDRSYKFYQPGADAGDGFHDNVLPPHESAVVRQAEAIVWDGFDMVASKLGYNAVDNSFAPSDWQCLARASKEAIRTVAEIEFHKPRHLRKQPGLAGPDSLPGQSL